MGFFSPPLHCAVAWSSLGHRLGSVPVIEQSADWTGSGPSGTGITPRFSTVDDGLQRSCRSDHQIVWGRPDSDIVADAAGDCETRVC